MSINIIFETKRPIIGMVHVQRGVNPIEDVKRLMRGGINGLLFENWGGDYTSRFADSATARSVIDAIKSARRTFTKHLPPFGVNILPLDYERDSEIVKVTGARFVQVDTFADEVITDYNNRFKIQPNPSEIRLVLEGVALFTNIQTKHYTTLPPDKKLETSTREAVLNGSDALVVTGGRTGEKTPAEKILRARSVADGLPVFIGSGLDVSNVKELLPLADGAIVGTGLKIDGITENPVDEGKVREFMELVATLR